MERERVIAILKAHEPEFRTAGVVGVSLFGSVARDENPAHDVDVAVRLDENFSRPGLDYVGRLSDLEQHLAEILIHLLEQTVLDQAADCYIAWVRTAAILGRVSPAITLHNTPSLRRVPVSGL